MTTYQRKQTPERVEAVRLTANIWTQTCFGQIEHAKRGQWLVVCPAGQYFMSDDEFRRGFEEVPAIPRHVAAQLGVDKPSIADLNRADMDAFRESFKKWSDENLTPDTPAHFWRVLPDGRRDDFNGGWWCERRGEYCPVMIDNKHSFFKDEEYGLRCACGARR